MENTNEDIKNIYFNENIENYTSKLIITIKAGWWFLRIGLNSHYIKSKNITPSLIINASIRSN